MRAQKILDEYSITGRSAKDIKTQFDHLPKTKRTKLVEDIAIALMGFSYQVGTAAYDGLAAPDARGNGMALISLLELLEPNHPFV